MSSGGPAADRGGGGREVRLALRVLLQGEAGRHGSVAGLGAQRPDLRAARRARLRRM